MLNKLTAPFLIIITILLSACTGKQSQPATGKVIDLSGIWDKPEQMLLSSIATDIEYIPLETNPACLLKDPTQIKATVFNRHIVVNSDGMKLFDRKGRFLRPIGALGKGPEEYSASGEFFMDEAAGKIFILDIRQQKVLIYRLSGEFNRLFRIGPEASRITGDPAGNIGIMYLPYRENNQDTARFEWLRDDGKILKSIPLYVGRTSDSGQVWSVAARMYWFENNLIFAEWPFDTVYSLVGNNVWKPHWIPVLGDMKIPREVSLDIDRWSAGRSHYRSVILNYESTRYLFFDGENNGKFGFVWYDKSTSSGHWKPGLMSSDSSKLEIIDNDLDSGLNLCSSWLNVVRDDQLITVVSPLDLITKFKNHPISELPLARPELREKLFKLVDRLHEDDNPVVMIVKLKTKDE